MGAGGQQHHVEPLLAETKARLSAFPIERSDLWDLYKRGVASFWTTEELDLSVDQREWETRLTNGERHFVSTVLAFFSASDGIVMENLASRFLREVQFAEARSFYAYQIFSEGIHGETYGLLLDTLVRDPEEKNRLFRAVEGSGTIAGKADWALAHIENATDFAERLVAFACVEGIFFSGSFCAIFWLKKRGLMPGLTFSNELISRDEGLHTDFACRLYRHHLHRRLSEEACHAIVAQAVALETGFICEALPCNLIGMNAADMTTYLHFVADRLLVELGHGKLFGAENPFDFMEQISLQGKTNFFEKRVGDYQLASTANPGNELVFSTSADF